MNPHFIFPASPLDSKMIDEAFQDQAIALKLAGFGTSVFSIEDNRIRPAILADVTLVYRGWMMSGSEYQLFWNWLTSAHGFNKILIDPEQYLSTHYLPNWYPLLERYTPDSVSFGNSEDMLERLYNFASGAFMAKEGLKLQVKDYVKSLKTAGGSVATSADEVKDILAKMVQYRGSLEGGVVLRKFEEFYAGSEIRYFVINGKFFGQEKMFDLRHMSILDSISRIVRSPFYSVDIALRVDGVARIIEIGDGQVSDLVGWTPDRFAEIWREASA